MMNGIIEAGEIKNILKHQDERHNFPYLEWAIKSLWRVDAESGASATPPN